MATAETFWGVIHGLVALSLLVLEILAIEKSGYWEETRKRMSDELSATKERLNWLLRVTGRHTIVAVARDRSRAQAHLTAKRRLACKFQELKSAGRSQEALKGLLHRTYYVIFFCICGTLTLLALSVYCGISPGFEIHDDNKVIKWFNVFSLLIPWLVLFAMLEFCVRRYRMIRAFESFVCKPLLSKLHLERGGAREGAIGRLDCLFYWCLLGLTVCFLRGFWHMMFAGGLSLGEVVLIWFLVVQFYIVALFFVLDHFNKRREAARRAARKEAEFIFAALA